MRQSLKGKYLVPAQDLGTHAPDDVHVTSLRANAPKALSKAVAALSGERAARGAVSSNNCAALICPSEPTIFAASALTAFGGCQSAF
ncbi:hypothetical protein CEE95_14710 [Lactobacillus crispatus]|nr:hypothetical protein CEE95_14710 [Lactobacillus crispatus]